MWTPSLKVSKLNPQDIRKYRTDDRFMKHCIGYSMPNHSDIYDIIETYIFNINKIENPISRAILAHYLFAPIQAFPDGNGRISRFLMNYILVSSGYNYLTITDHQYRLKYLSQYGLEKEEQLKTLDSFYSFIVKSINENDV